MACHLIDLDTDQAIYLVCILLRMCFVSARCVFSLLTSWRNVTGIRTATNNKWWCIDKDRYQSERSFDVAAVVDSLEDGRRAWPENWLAVSPNAHAVISQLPLHIFRAFPFGWELYSSILYSFLVRISFDLHILHLSLLLFLYSLKHCTSFVQTEKLYFTRSDA